MFLLRSVPARLEYDPQKVYNEKLRVLRRLKPELFDADGTLRSKSGVRSHSWDQHSLHSSGKYGNAARLSPINGFHSISFSVQINRCLFLDATQHHFQWRK